MKKTILTLIASVTVAAGVYATVVTGTILDSDLDFVNASP